jgi:hypothetical protein
MPIAGNYTGTRPITPSDSVDVGLVGSQVLFDAIYVGGAGVVAVVLQDGTVQNFTAVAGEVIPIRGKRVNSTNTTATLLVALYYA